MNVAIVEKSRRTGAMRNGTQLQPLTDRSSRTGKRLQQELLFLGCYPRHE